MIEIEIPFALSYDDVLLVPKRSSARSRGDVDVSSFLTQNIRMKIPLVSANMDAVTESAMAIAMAREGAIGFIHRFLTMDDQVAEVLKVKRSESMIVDEPYTISKEKTVREARQFIR